MIATLAPSCSATSAWPVEYTSLSRPGSELHPPSARWVACSAGRQLAQRRAIGACPAQSEQLIAALFGVARRPRSEERARPRDRGVSLRLLARMVIHLHRPQAERGHGDAAVRRRRPLVKAIPVPFAVLTRDQ